MSRRLVAAAMLMAAGVGADAAGAACRQALAIGLDVSGSVDAREYLFQVRGLAAALLSGPVVDLILEQPEAPVALAVYDWSGAEDQRLILGWTAITDRAALEGAAATIAATARVERSPATGVGAAMRYGAELLSDRAECWRWTLDLTGDGLNNSGVAPRDLVLRRDARPLTVNALVVAVNGEEGWDGGDPGIAELSAWFRAEVIRGPGAFVETALGFEDFAEAMQRKLLKELAGQPIGQLAPAGGAATATASASLGGPPGGQLSVIARTGIGGAAGGGN